MKIEIIIGILFIHWFADFLLQTDWQAQNKSKDWEALINHTFIYSCCWILPSTYWFSGMCVPIFFGITFISHTITDYFTSRLNSRLWAKGDVHNFFVSVGFDQFLHFVQLILTFKLLE